MRKWVGLKAGGDFISRMEGVITGEGREEDGRAGG